MTRQCLLGFHINILIDWVLCDVVEMDTCHVFLGKSWIFDRSIFHDVRESVEKIPMILTRMGNVTN